MPELCTVCITEYDTDKEHTCYDPVDRKYVEQNTLTEFFIQCGFCHRKAALSALWEGSENGWKRIKKPSALYRGYICKGCSAHFIK